MEIGRLQEHVGGALGHTRVQTAEHAADAHRLLAVADHQVAVGERALHAVEGDELGARGGGPDDDAVALDLAQVKAMHGLSGAQQYVVGDIDDVVDGTLAHGEQQVLEPLGTLLHLHAAHGKAGIAGAGLGVLDGDGDAAVDAVAGEVVNAGTVQMAVHAVALHPSRQVACHTVVRAAVNAVGGEVHLDEVVVLDAVVLGCGSAHHSVLGQDDDAVMAGAHTDFVLGANHAQRLLAAHLAALDGEFLVAVIEFGAQGGDDDLLAGGHVGSTAHDLDGGIAVAQVNGGDVQVVTVGVVDAGHYLSHDQAAQAALDGFYLFNCAHFQTQRGQCLGHLLGCQVGVNVAFEPFIGNIHNAE